MKSFFYALTLLFFISCSNGEIQHTVSNDCGNGQGVFLVSTSNSKQIQFTVKSYPNNQSNVVTNTTYILEPGAQTFLGCSNLEHDYHYEIVGEREIK